MIYNRTYIDIINAKKIFTNKIQKFLDLTEDEQNTIDKAFFNLKAINRITSKINDIWVEIVKYEGTKIENNDVRVWNKDEFFNIVNFLNIRQNIGEIVTELVSIDLIDIENYQDVYNKLTDDYVYINLNNLEKLLYDIYNIFQRFVIVKGSVMYITTTYNVVENEGELIIE